MRAWGDECRAVSFKSPSKRTGVLFRRRVATGLSPCPFQGHAFPCDARRALGGQAYVRPPSCPWRFLGISLCHTQLVTHRCVEKRDTFVTIPCADPDSGEMPFYCADPARVRALRCLVLPSRFLAPLGRPPAFDSGNRRIQRHLYAQPRHQTTRARLGVFVRCCWSGNVFDARRTANTTHHQPLAPASLLVNQ